MPHLLQTVCALRCMAALAAGPIGAEDVIVTVEGAHNIPGEVACRFYDSSGNFPFGKATSGEVRSGRSADSTACAFRNLAPGSYALVAAILPKGQDDVTRNFLARPHQPWGVSNTIRHALRAPRFDEAMFTAQRGTAPLKVALAK